jgi:CBS domain-containing protein
MKTVQEILRVKGGKTWSVSAKATVYDALKLMSEKAIGALMVLDEKDEVAGIISERDYARKVILLGKTSKETRVSEIMTPVSHMFMVKPENSVEECMVLMTQRHVRHLPVFEGGRFIGIISIGDIVKSIIEDKDALIAQLNDYISGKYI